MKRKFKFLMAKKYQAEKIARLFALISRKIDKTCIAEQIKSKRVYILKHKKKIIAAFSFSIIGIAGYFAILYIGKLAVDPEFQGKGIGTLIISKIQKTGIKAGAAAILLFSVKTAKKFYEKNKFSNIWRLFWKRVNAR